MFDLLKLCHTVKILIYQYSPECNYWYQFLVLFLLYLDILYILNVIKLHYTYITKLTHFD